MYYPWDKVAKKTYGFINSGEYDPNRSLCYELITDRFGQSSKCSSADVFLPQDYKDFVEFCANNNPDELDKIRWIHVRMHNSFEPKKIKF